MTASAAPEDAVLHPPEFEGFPYLVTRVGRTPLRHIALLPAEWSFDRQAEADRAVRYLAAYAGLGHRCAP